MTVSGGPGGSAPRASPSARPACRLCSTGAAEPNLFGRPLQVTVVGHADEIAAGASLLMGQAGEGRPVVLVRGLTPSGPLGAAIDLIRPEAEDLFR